MGQRESAYYKIDIQSLGVGEHTFEFDIDSEFFKKFENSPVSRGQLKCELSLEKNERLINVQMKIFGTVELVCDNSLKLFDHSLELEQGIVFKYGDEYQELDESTIQIARNTDQLNMKDLIFEFIVLGLPMRKIHPDYVESEGVFYSTAQENEENETEASDPRWAALKGLKK